MRNAIRTLTLAAGLCLPAVALAQPANTFLGALAMNGTPLDSASFNTAAGAVTWFSFTLAAPVRYEDLKWLDIYSLNQATVPDCQISLWDSVGNRIATDDDDGPGFSSQLSFGTGASVLDATPGTGTAPLVFNGRDGDLLAAGTYYVSVSYFNVVEGNTGWSITTPSTTAVNNVLLRINGGNTPAVVDPAGTIDLGTVTYGIPVSDSAGSLSAGTPLQWYKAVLPSASNAGGTYIDMDLEGSALAPSNTTRLTVYTAGGAQASLEIANSTTTMSDTVDGSNSLSQLTFGLVAPARAANPGPTAGLTYNGRDGSLRAGTYYFVVGGVGSAPSLTTAPLPTNFGMTSTSTNYGTLKFNINAVAPSVPPSGTGTVSPAFGSIGQSSTVFVTALPGNNPPSAVSGVSLDATSIDGGTVALSNSGVLPDVSSLDNIWTGTVTVGPLATLGAHTMIATISDSQGVPRTGTANINYTVVGAPPLCPSGDEAFSFSNLDSEGAAGAGTNGVGSFSPTGTYNAVAYRITGRFIPNTAFSTETRIRITQPSGAFIDTQAFLVNGPAGTPVDFTSADIPLPCGPIANSGAWGVRIYETVTDAAVPDGVWANLCVSLVSGVPGGDPTIWIGDTCIGDAGELLTTFQTPVGSGPLNSIVGATGTADVDMFLINICDPLTFTATTNVGASLGLDTQLFLFNGDSASADFGKGVIFNDDETGVGPSKLDNLGGQITAPGNYLIAVGRYNRDPVDAAAALLWINTPFTGVRIPDGPGAANPLAGWVNTVTASGYTIGLTGVCYPVTNPCAGGPAACNIADITEVGGSVETPGCPDGQLTVDDVIVFVNAFGDGIGCPGVAPCNISDVTDIGDTGAGPDGELSVDDVIAFFNAFSDGCV